MTNPIVGQEIDGYHIQEVLGRGGMGVVYKAEDTSLSRPVAIKRLNPQLAGDESFLSRFRSEARAIARVNSPYIVQIFTLSETEIGLVIVMEYVEGRTLKQRITAGETNWRESLPLIQQMLTALQHAHDAGVIHRDIKPQNILLSDIVLAHGIRVKVTDFGLAKVNTSGDPSRTVTEGVYGTLHYMSPEQVEAHGEIDHRSDIYSLGMTCYEMLAGRLPFEEDSSEYTIMRTIVEEDLPELGTFATGVPGELQDIIMKAVAKDPANRFQSAVEMQEALGKLEGASEQGYPDRDPETIPSDLGPPAPGALTNDAPVPPEGAPAEEEGESASAPPAQKSSSWGTLRRVVGAGAVLAVVLAGVWYFAVGVNTPTAEPEQEATAAVERGTPEGTTSEGGAAGETQEENSAPTEKTSENASEKESAGKAPSGETDSDTEPSGGNASDRQVGQTAEEQPTGANTGGQAMSAGVDAVEEKTADAEATGTEAADQEAADQEASDQEASDQEASDQEAADQKALDQEASAQETSDRETADTNENQETSRPDLPSPIAALLGIDDPSVLSKRVDELVNEGQLTRGDEPGDFFKPGQCYIFIVGSGRVEAVLGPETDGTRVELRSGEDVEDWSSRYSNNRQIWVK